MGEERRATGDVALVVGKFAPLHKGHMLVIDRAREAADEVVVAVYETAGYGPPAETRAGWIRELYPDTTVLVLDDPAPGGDPEAVSRAYAEHFAARFERRVTHVFTSEEYGARFAQYLGAAHVSVDPERKAVPISSTTIRRAPFENRRFVHPLVYRTLVPKICFVGAESTGKTTLTVAMAERFETVFTPEYGRSVFEAATGGLAESDYFDIARDHLRQENELAVVANRFLFCDTNVLATLFWSRFYLGTSDSRLERLADDVAPEYEYILCSDDIVWFQDGWRETGGGSFWREHQRMIRDDLEQRGLPYVEARGSLAERVKHVAAWLESRFSGAG